MQAAGNGWFEVEIRSRPFGEVYGFILADGTVVPDPASRHQVDVRGLSTLVDPTSYQWRHSHWKGRPWQEALFYELHIGTFTQEGTFRSAMERLAYLADIGFTAVEVMPLAQFPGERGWGYDGVFQYAPFSGYGSPDDFKAFVDAAHGHGLMVFLDVVYNHFGPTGNFLSSYAPDFFLEDNPTPWGPRIAFASEPVRRFFIENAIYWLTEFHLDGLRLDAIDMITDPSETHILEELSVEAYASVRDRQIHLITENPANGTDLMALRPDGTRLFKADWNDDFHHALHVAVTGESTGHYAPLSDKPWEKTANALAHGYIMDGKRILDVDPPPSSSLPTTCFVHFLQNHDQIGNRALGDRLHTSLDQDLYAALVEVLALSPQVPLFFMGDDHLSTRPFRFFTDYEGELRANVWANRETEARNFGGFPADFGPEDIPDPSRLSTFEDSRIDWVEADRPEAGDWRAFLKNLFRVRAFQIVPIIGKRMLGGTVVKSPERCLFVDWRHGQGTLHLRANLSEDRIEIAPVPGVEIYSGKRSQSHGSLDGYSVRVWKSTSET